MKRTRILVAILILSALWAVYGMGEKEAGVYSTGLPQAGKLGVGAMAAFILASPVYGYLLMKKRVSGI